MRTKLTFSLIALLFLSAALQAQDTFQELMELDDKKFERKALDLWDPGRANKKGEGASPDMTKKEVKDVALVAFTILGEETGYSYGFQSKAWGTYGFTDAGKDYFAARMYHETIDDIEKSFQDNGMNLITMEEMSDEQKEIMQASTEELQEKLKEASATDKKDKLSDKFMNIGGNFDTKGAAYNGYKNWNNTQHIGVYWNKEVYAALTELLDVDAILFVTHNLRREKKEIVYTGALMNLHGPNPIPAGDQWHPGLSYCNGMAYASVKLEPKDAIPMADVEKKGRIIDKDYEHDWGTGTATTSTTRNAGLSGENYEGLGAVVNRTMNVMLSDLQRRSKGED